MNSDTAELKGQFRPDSETLNLLSAWLFRRELRGGRSPVPWWTDLKGDAMAARCTFESRSTVGADAMPAVAGKWAALPR